MFSRLHSRLGTAGFVIAIVALVAAVGGSAFAAAVGLNGKQKQEVKKIAKNVTKTVVGPAGAEGAKGAAGAGGAKGEPWTAGGTLPSGSTETGAWGGTFEGEDVVMISFPIPLAASLDGEHVKKVNEAAVPPAQCDNGTGAAASAENPEADPGYLCVFVSSFENGGSVPAILNPNTGGSGAATFGTGVLMSVKAPAEADFALGSFAVTAP